MFDFNMVVYLIGLACSAGLMIGRITALEKKVDKHNGLVERMYAAEKSIEILEEKIIECKHA